MLERDRSKSLRNVLALSLLAVFCLYLPTLFHPIFADDNVYLAFSNRLLRDSGWLEVYKLLLAPANSWEYLPVRDLTYWLDFRLFGDEPAAFHASNLVWYVFACCACYLFTLELTSCTISVKRDELHLLALGATLLFAVHPAHVEAVAWIASRKDIVAGALSFFAFAFLIRALYKAPSNFTLTSGIFFFLLACFSKASALSGILVITALLAMGWPGLTTSEKTKRFFVVAVCWGLTLAVAFVHYRTGELAGIRIDNAPGAFALLDRASRILVTLVGLVVFPQPPHLYHDVYQLGDWHWAASIALIALVLLSLLALIRRKGLLPFAVLMLLAPISMYFQLSPFSTWSMASDRFVFLSVAGPGLAWIGLGLKIGAPPRWVAAISFFVAIPMGITVWLRVNDWEGRMALMDREQAIQPGFHNVIRDEIAYRLIPERKYEEALILAARVSRPYAADALRALILTHRSYRELRDAPTEEGGRGEHELVRPFCASVHQLKAALTSGFAEIKSEPDITYNNLLRTAEQALKYQYADEKRLCGG